jgi:curved DNA-binding protein CbpA
MPEPVGPFKNWYEILGVPPNATVEDLARVYHLLAARFHPDNQETGDLDRFLEVKAAYETLSDPAARKQFDVELRTQSQEPVAVFLSKDFADGVTGEFNRRLGILCLLYNQRKLNSRIPSLSIPQLETMMSIPREHLEFTIWYLKQKKMAAIDDRSNLAITSEGIDFVEENLPKEETVQKLLKSPKETRKEAAEAA